MEILLGVYDSSLLKSKYKDIYWILVFFMNWILIKWGCDPSDCQKVFVLSSRSCSTPFPVLAELNVQTASAPISLRWWLLVGGEVDWV